MPAVIGDLSALKTARRKLTAEGLAEGEGFEPSIRFPVYTLSKRAPSATRPPLRVWSQSQYKDAPGGFRTSAPEQAPAL